MQNINQSFMTLKQSIDQDVYTNSLLIYPYFDEENLTEFYWRRRNPFFFTNYYQKINQHLPDLSYQCTILDYNSVIELVILDKNNQKHIFSYGPTKLQPQLGKQAGNELFRHDINVHFNKKQKIQGSIKIRKKQNNIEAYIQINSGLQIIFRSKIATNIQDIINVEGVEGNELIFYFLQNKKEILEVLKVLKIYSLNGNFIKLSFQNQFKRDFFLLQYLVEFGFQLQQNTGKTNPEQLKFQEKTQKNIIQKSHNSEQQIQGFFPQQKDPISPITPSNAYFHFGGKNLTKKQSFRNCIIEKIDAQFLKDHNVSESIYWESETEFNNNSEKQKRQIQQIQKKKENRLNQKHKKNSQKRDSDMTSETYEQIIKRFKRIEQENRYLKNQNKQLKKTIKNFKGKKLEVKEVPQFIKVRQINKAIKKMTDNFSHEKEKQEFHKKCSGLLSHKAITFGKQRRKSQKKTQSHISSSMTDLEKGFSLTKNSISQVKSSIQQKRSFQMQKDNSYFKLGNSAINKIN